MTIDYHSGKFLLISFKVSLHEFILGFSHCVCGRRCTPMFHTEDRAAGKDKSLTFSMGPKFCLEMDVLFSTGVPTSIFIGIHVRNHLELEVSRIPKHNEEQ